MTSRPLRAGLVGYGFAGQTFHAPVLSAVPGLELAAVASSQPQKVQADWPGAAVVPDVAALIARADIDLVVVATPNAQHHPVAKAALEAGKHVVVDKPFTLDVAQAKELASLASRNNRILSVYQNRRFDADFLTLKDLLASGELGRVVYLESHFDRFRPEVRARWREQAVPGSGLWVDLGAHLVDQAVQLFGQPDTLQLDTAVLRDGAAGRRLLPCRAALRERDARASAGGAACDDAGRACRAALHRARHARQLRQAWRRSAGRRAARRSAPGGARLGRRSAGRRTHARSAAMAP
jgi:predicted dehydrogenase